MSPQTPENPGRFEWKGWGCKLVHSTIGKKLDWSLPGLPESNPFRSMLQHCEERAIQWALLQWCSFLSCSQGWKAGPEGSIKELEAIRRRMDKLNYNQWDEDRYTTPTREAMRGASGFRRWVSMLNELNINLDEFAVAEAPLVEDGWTSRTLLRLLQNPYRSTPVIDAGCESCGRDIDDQNYLDETPWHDYLERLKKGVEPSTPWTQDERENQRPWNEYIGSIEKEGVCIECFRK